MGQEMSCTSRGKWPTSIDDGLDALVDGVEEATTLVEHAIADATRAPPAKTTSNLSDKERSYATALFWQLDYWHGTKEMPASLRSQMHRLRSWRNAAEHRDALRWRREGPKSDAEFNELVETIKTRLEVLNVQA